MGDRQRHERFQELRRRELAGALSPEEHDELARLVQELEQQEATYLSPATERLRREYEEMLAENRALEALANRKEALIQHLDSVLAKTRAERTAIAEEEARLLSRRAAGNRVGV
jgi:hypothetical protein